jgi:hypothetical protein
MNAERDTLSLVDMGAEIFHLVRVDQNATNTAPMTATYLVRVMITRGTFHGGGKVEDDFVVRCSFPPSFENSVPELNRKLRLGLGESLQAIIKGEFSP